MSKPSPTRLQLARRAFLQALGATTIPLWLPGCDSDSSEQFPQRQFRFATPTPTVEVEKATIGQGLLHANPYYCSLPKQLAGIADIGDQIRVTRNDHEFAVYTVAEHRAQDNPSLLRMSLHARQRLNDTGSFAARIGPVANSKLNDAEAEAAGEFVERLDDNGECTGLLVLAPHGGEIELQTDMQAEYVRAALPNSSLWLCKGWDDDGDAYERWHVTSTAISPNSFPLLATIADRGFTYAVAFHGMKAAGVLVGGAAPLELRASVRNAIAEVVGNSAGPVLLAADNAPLDGNSPNNLVNWLTAEGMGGVQIEQSHKVRSEYGEAVAQAIVNVFQKRV